MADPVNMTALELLRPLSQEEPCGRPPAGTQELADLKLFRSEELAVEEGTAEGGARTTNWDRVAGKAHFLLTRVGKDLRVALWLTEALVRTRGFGGLAVGLEVILGLHEDLWEQVHPRLPADDPGDVSEREGIVRGLIHPTFIGAVLGVPLTAKVGSTPGKSLHELRQLKATPSRGAEFDRAADASPRELYAQLGEDLDECISLLGQLSAKTRERYVAEGGIRLANLNQVLKEVQEVVNKRRPVVIETPPDTRPPPDPTPSLPPTPQGPVPQIVEPTPAPVVPHGESAAPQVKVEDAVRLATSLWRAQQHDRALSVLQRAYDLATTGRERYLRRLEAAEVCVQVGQLDLARPLLEELAQIEQKRGLREWEHPQVWARLCDGLVAVRLNPAPKAKSPQAAELFEQLARTDLARAYRALAQLHEGV